MPSGHYAKRGTPFVIIITMFSRVLLLNSKFEEYCGNLKNSCQFHGWCFGFILMRG